MAKKRPIDINLLAHQVMQEATGEAKPEEKPEKNPNAVALGRLGGLKGGKSRADKLSKERKIEIAKQAAKKRWSK